MSSRTRRTSSLGGKAQFAATRWSIVRAAGGDHAAADTRRALEELIQAYRTADVLVHPSRYEGFGLQVLEAMSCGLPVVCSDGGSLPEVAGDAALVVSPDDVDGYVRCVGKVLKDSGTRAKLVEAGFKQAGGFTWRRSAEATLEVYGKLWTGLGKPLPLPSKT